MSTGVPADRTNTHLTDTSDGWYGWIAFGGVMMVILGSFHAVAGLIGVFKEEYYLVGKNDLVVTVDYTTWGWVHIIGGLIIAGAGVALFTGKTWARTIGVLLALASSIVNISFLAAYPIWSTIMITVDILVIWALTVHGSEMKE